MAQATAIKFSKFRVLLGTGTGPIVYTAPCGFNSRSLKLSKEANEVDIPDCDKEDAPAWKAREVKSNDWQVSGEGLLVQESVDTWLAAYDSTVSIPVRVELIFPGGTRVREGYAVMTNFEINGERGQGRVSANIELMGDGELIAIP